MLKNQLTFAIRAFRKHARTSILNLLGLTIGLASALLISLYVYPEVQADQNFPLGDRIYKVNWQLLQKDGENRTYALTGGTMAPELYEKSSAVFNFCRFQHHTSELLLTPEGRPAVKGEGVLFADSSFYTFFPSPVVAGDPSTWLQAPASIVLTESLADKLFNDTDPMGQLVEGHNKVPYTVTGIISDPNQYSHLSYDALVSWSTTVPGQGPLDWHWMNREAGNIQTYILLPEGAEPNQLQAALDQYGEDLEFGEEDRLITQPMPEMYLHSAGIEFTLPGQLGDHQTILILIALGVFILVNACINYINIQTARANERLREMGMRKTMGASRRGLIVQVLSETLVLTLTAAVLAYVVAQSVAPSLARWVGMNLDVSLLVNPGYLAVYLGLCIGLVLLAGGYPSLVLSGFHPSEAFAQHISMNRSGGRLRQVLTTVQFATSLLVITGTLVIYQQVRFQQNKDLGFDLNQVVQLPLTSTLDSLQENFRLALDEVPGVEKTSISLDVLGVGGTSSVTGINKVAGVEYDISGRYFGMDAEFTET
ncbi:MAG: ABC transporter permease, partial [Bacteroidota bacterium]